MCGIITLSTAPASRLARDVRPLVRALLVAAESRGRHATGVGYLDPADSWPSYWRTAGRASRVCWSAPIPARAPVVIGHTRYATQGSPKDNRNNHPVVAPGIVAVHNGVVTNDDDILATLGYERSGAVDSEAWAALLSAGPEVLGASSVVDLLDVPRGRAALAWLSTEDALLRLARVQSSPLAIAHTAAGDFLAASTPHILRSAAAKIGLGLWGVETVPEGTYLEVDRGRIVTWERFTPPADTTVGPALDQGARPTQPTLPLSGYDEWAGERLAAIARRRGASLFARRDGLGEGV